MTASEAALHNVEGAKQLVADLQTTDKEVAAIKKEISALKEKISVLEGKLEEASL